MEEREYHYHGKNSDENSTALAHEIIHERSITHTPRPCPVNGSQPATEYPRLSDEFLNEYIPENLSTFVTWKDVLACGMIPEQRGGSGGAQEEQDYLRKDIRYKNQCLPEAPSPAPAPTNMIVEAEAIKKHNVNCERR